MTATPPPSPTDPGERARLGAYALIVRDGRVLLSRLAPRVVDHELWTLPGGGVEPGEDPNDAVLREVYEETGLTASVGDRALVRPVTVERDGRPAHSVRLVFDGVVPRDAPEPHVVEVDGSTADAAWFDLADVRGGRVPVTALVTEALAAHAPRRLQRLAAYGLATRDGGRELLLTRISPLGHHAGSWTLPGGGVDHGEPPAAAVAREFTEETGLSAHVGALLGVHDVHFVGTAPDGGTEDYHGVHLVFAVDVAPDAAPPAVTELDGTTDLVAWVPVADVRSGALPVLDLVRDAVERFLPEA